MKKLLRNIGIALIVLVVGVLGGLRVFGFSPKDGRPGLWLVGDVVTTEPTDWSFTDAVNEIHVQTQGPYLLPHSVTIQCASLNGQLYIASFHTGGPSAPRRLWNQNIERDPRVRLRIGDQLYDRRAIPLTDPVEIDNVFQAYIKKYPTWKRVSEQPADKRPQIYYWRTEAT